MKFSTAFRNRIRNTLISTFAFALGLGLIASSHAQSYRSKANQETTQTLATKESNGSRVDRHAMRPFRVNIPKEALVDLRRRIAATRWPDKETVTDRSQGVQLEKLQALVRYWGTDYNWRMAEAKLNALPQFVTNIDGLDIHFIHVRSRHPNPLPLIMTHGWPGSVIELLSTIGPLTDPVIHSGRLDETFFSNALHNGCGHSLALTSPVPLTPLLPTR